MRRLMFGVIAAVFSLVVLTQLTAVPAAAQCGNGVIDPGEGCDPPAPPCCSAACQCVLGATCTGCFASGLCNYTGAPSTCVCDTNVAFPPLDHYRLYNAGGPIAGRTVTLRDQFHTENDVDLGPVLFFMPPVEKNGEPFENPFDHLTCYHIPVGQFTASVLVDNQFGPDQGVEVRNPVALCVPTQKFLPGEPPPPPTRIDHYKCYDAAGTPPPQPVPVTLIDQFQGQLVTLREPFLFCNPVDKNGEGITNPVDHLTCYFTDPPGGPVGPIQVANQFHTLEVIDVHEPFALCVPSKKLEVTLPACADSAPQCNGTCPAADQTCERDATGGCVCLSAGACVCGTQCQYTCPDGTTVQGQCAIRDAAGQCYCTGLCPDLPPLCPFVGPNECDGSTCQVPCPGGGTALGCCDIPDPNGCLCNNLTCGDPCPGTPG